MKRLLLSCSSAKTPLQSENTAHFFCSKTHTIAVTSKDATLQQFRQDALNDTNSALHGQHSKFSVSKKQHFWWEIKLKSTTFRSALLILLYLGILQHFPKLHDSVLNLAHQDKSQPLATHGTRWKSNLDWQGKSWLC